jgi:hypothetical protein
MPLPPTKACFWQKIATYLETDFDVIVVIQTCDCPPSSDVRVIAGNVWNRRLVEEVYTWAVTFALPGRWCRDPDLD